MLYNYLMKNLNYLLIFLFLVPLILFYLLKIIFYTPLSMNDQYELTEDDMKYIKKKLDDSNKKRKIYKYLI
jgi:hypothetical protein